MLTEESVITGRLAPESCSHHAQKCPKMYLHTILLNIFIIIQIYIKLAAEIHLIILIHIGHRYTINIP